MKPLIAVVLAWLLPAAALAADPPRPPAELQGTVGAGLIILTGNSEATTFTLGAAASRETYGWIVSGKASAAYGESRPPAGGPRTTSALNGGAQLRLDRKLGEIWTVYGLGGVEADHVASIEYRTQAEVGASAQWIDQKQDDWQRLGLRTDLGFRYGYEARWQYYGTPTGPLPGVELLAPRLGLAFRYGFSKEVFFTEDAEVLPNVSGPSRVLAKSISKLSSRLGKSMSLGITYTVAYDSAPAEGKVNTDTGLSAMLEVGF
jgi:opacity protein-like surface antigen